MANERKRDRESPEPESTASLLNQARELNNSIKIKKRKVKAHGSFNAQFWAASYEYEALQLQASEVNRKISLGLFKEKYKDSEARWEQTDDAKSLFQQIKARKTSMEIYKKRAGDADDKRWPAGRSKRAAFMQFFTTSKMGISISNTGAGSRDSTKQSAMRTELVRVHDARNAEDADLLWCPVLGAWIDDNYMQAAHLFPYMHGQVAMDAIFGKKRPEELFSAANGMLIASCVEKVFDSGKIVIVPDLPEERSPIAEVLAWARRETRDYRIKVIDPTWDRLDKQVTGLYPKTWRQIDGKKLEFRTKFRPAARYVYFHYCIQVLRRAWAHNDGAGSFLTLRDESGKPFWGTPGRYLPRNVLLGLVEELGHEYKDLLEGAGCSKGKENNKLLLEAGALQINKRPALKNIGWGRHEPDEHEAQNEDDDEDKDENSSENDNETLA